LSNKSSCVEIDIYLSINCSGTQQDVNAKNAQFLIFAIYGRKWIAWKSRPFHHIYCTIFGRVCKIAKSDY